MRFDGEQVREYIPDAIEETGIPMADEEEFEEEPAKRPAEDDGDDHEEEVQRKRQRLASLAEKSPTLLSMCQP